MVERSEERKAQPVMEETQPINLGTADEPQEVRIGTTLTLEERTSLIDLFFEGCLCSGKSKKKRIRLLDVAEAPKRKISKTVRQLVRLRNS